MSTPEVNTTASTFNNPQYLTPLFDNIPDELKALRRWILWVAIQKAGKPKPDKVPVQVNGWGASTTNRKHWNAFDRVRAAYEAAVGRGYFEYRTRGAVQRVQVAGIGFVFDDSEPDADGYVYAGVDFDHVVRGKVTSIDDGRTVRAREHLKQLRSYTEKSVSGDGLHVIVKARPIGRGAVFGGIEVYTTGRYFAFTGHTGRGLITIVAADTALRALAAELRVQAGDGGDDAATPDWSFMGRMKSDGLHARYGDPGGDTLGAGIDNGEWFGSLDDAARLEVIRYAVAAIPPEKFGSEEGWGRLARALAHTAWKYPHLAGDLWEILDKASSASAGYDLDENERRWHRYVNEASQHPKPITIGTVFRWATDNGCEFDKWKFAKASEATAALNLPVLLKKREPLRFGLFSEDAALAMLNQHYLVSVGDADRGKIFAITEDGTLAHITRDDFGIATAKIRIRVGSGNDMKTPPAAPIWLGHAQGNAKAIVFKPGKHATEDEYNEWRGFGVSRQQGRDKIMKLLKHVYRYLCCGNSRDYRYLIKWCAWVVQHPDEHAETVVMLRSANQGSGKTTLAKTMRKIIGPAHAMSLGRKNDLLGDFNEHLHRRIFIQAEETVWAGDHAAASTLRDMVTSDVLTIHPKHRKARSVPNYLNFMFCSNHAHAAALGVNERRTFTLDVDESKAEATEENKAYWNALYKDLENGGYEQFLDFLLSINLDGWHPRDMPRTEATKTQMRMSGDSFVQWMQTSLEVGFVTGGPLPLKFSDGHPTVFLLKAYVGYCKERSDRPMGTKQFSQCLIQLFGRRTKVNDPVHRGQRVNGYNVPDEDTLRKGVDALMGIKE